MGLLLLVAGGIRTDAPSNSGEGWIWDRRREGEQEGGMEERRKGRRITPGVDLGLGGVKAVSGLLGGAGAQKLSASCSC